MALWCKELIAVELGDSVERLVDATNIGDEVANEGTSVRSRFWNHLTDDRSCPGPGVRERKDERVDEKNDINNSCHVDGGYYISIGLDFDKYIEP